MASLLKQGGLYYLEFYHRDRRPTKKRVPLRTRTKRTAERLKIQREDALALGAYDPWRCTDPDQGLAGSPAPRSIEEAIGSFILAKAHRRPETVRKYRYYLNAFARSLPNDVTLATVAAAHIKTWLALGDTSATTKRTYLRHLRVFLRHCVQEEWIADDVTARVSLPRKTDHSPAWLKPEEVDRLVVSIRADGKHDWLADAVLLAAHTGLRRGELLSLRWDHIDFDARLLHVINSDQFSTKSGRDRTVALSDIAITVLASRHSARSAELVFTHSKGRIDGTYCSHLFKRYARRAGFQSARFHSLRHSACSWLVAGGASIETVRRFAGHADIQTSARYMHLADDVYSAEVRLAMDRASRDSLS